MSSHDHFFDDVDQDEESTFEYGEVTVVKESGEAILCKAGGRFGPSFWVPRSQLREPNEVWNEGDRGTLVVTEWLAEERGWL